MKKSIITILVILSTLTVQAQKIVHDGINEFNKRIVNTSWEKVNWKSTDHKLEIGMMLEGFDKSILINWQCSEMVGAERNSEIILKFDDGSESILLNKVFSVSGAGKITTDNVPPTQMGIQLDAKGEFGELEEKDLTEIKINTLSGEVRFPVNKKESESLRKMYLVFEKHCQPEK